MCDGGGDNGATRGVGVVFGDEVDVLHEGEYGETSVA